MAEKTSIYIVVANQRLLKDVKRVLNKLEFVASPEAVFPDAESFLEAYAAEKPACLITEFALPGMAGLELQEALLKQRIRRPVIFVADQPITQQIVTAMRNGAVTVLDMPLSVGELWKAIDEARNRHEEALRSAALHADARLRLASLSAKERRVLKLMMKGKPNKAIANELDVSIRTVELRRKRIFSQTKTGSLAELVRLVLQAETEGDNGTSFLEPTV